MNDFRIGARGRRVTIHFDGTRIEAFEGETVSTALWAHGIRGWNGGRAYFCAMGVCQQCAVWIDGTRVEACRTPARDGMRVTSS
jgi:predicted molibdopterin-dependent oxidoreductase YjgC